VIRTVFAAVAVVLLTAAPALAQVATTTGEPTVPKAAAPWTYYMAIATIGIAVLTLLLAVLGYMVQAPGFRRGQRSGQAS
jgi:hypothetical protein